LYYVWYQKAGVGSDPAPASAAKGIKVSLTGFETDVQVAFKTQLALNSAMWASPSLGGAFLRCIEDGQYYTNDPDFDYRTGYCKGVAGNKIGSLQTTQNLIHNHSTEIYDAKRTVTGGAGSSYWSDYTTTVTGNTGGNQSNPANIYVNYVIKI